MIVNSKISKRKVLATRNVSKRGGSLQVTIPASVAEIMELEPGDLLIFSYDPKTKEIILGKISKKDLESLQKFNFSLPQNP